MSALTLPLDDRGANLETVGGPESCERPVNQLNKLPLCSSDDRLSLHCQGKLKTSWKGALTLCLTLTLSVTACQEKPPSPYVIIP